MGKLLYNNGKKQHDLIQRIKKIAKKKKKLKFSD